VKSFPATRSITSRPRIASRRKPDAVMLPSGKASAAAILKRSGASGRMLSDIGILVSTFSCRIAASRI
jgi:hypothetical protein